MSETPFGSRDFDHIDDLTDAEFGPGMTNLVCRSVENGIEFTLYYYRDGEPRKTWIVLTPDKVRRHIEDLERMLAKLKNSGESV